MVESRTLDARKGEVGCFICTRGDQSDPWGDRPVIETPGGACVYINIDTDSYRTVYSRTEHTSQAHYPSM